MNGGDEMKRGFSVLTIVALWAFNFSATAHVVEKKQNNERPQSVVFNEVAQACSANVHHNTLQALVRVESGFNPYAIGVVGGAVKQPTTFAEAVETAKALEAAGKNFSMGLGQINKHNLKPYGLDFNSVFDVCKNLNTAGLILSECFNRASGEEQVALQKALSCYYSGNFKTGFTKDIKGQVSYVDRVKKAFSKNSDDTVIKKIPELDTTVVVQSSASPAKATVAKAKVSVKKSTTPEPLEPLIVKTKQKQTWDVFDDF